MKKHMEQSKRHLGIWNQGSHTLYIYVHVLMRICINTYLSIVYFPMLVNLIVFHIGNPNTDTRAIVNLMARDLHNTHILVYFLDLRFFHIICTAFLPLPSISSTYFMLIECTLLCPTCTYGFLYGLHFHLPYSMLLVWRSLPLLYSTYTWHSMWHGRNPNI